MLFPFAQSQPSGGFAETIDNLARTPLSQVVLFVGICTVLRVAIFPYLRKTPAHQRHGPYPVAKFVNEVFDAVIYAGVFVFMVIRPFAVQTFQIPSGSMIPTLLVNDFIVANKAVYRYSDPKPGDIVVFRPPAYACTPSQLDESGEAKVDFIKRCQGVGGELIEIKEDRLFRNGSPDPDANKHFTGMDHNSADGVTTSGPMPDFKLVLYNGPTYRNWNGRVIPVVTMPGGDPNRDPSYTSYEFAVGAASHDGGFVREFNRDLSVEEQQVIDYLRKAPPAKIPDGMFLMIGDNRNGSFDGRAWGLISRDDVVGRSEAIWLPLRRIGRTR